MRSSNKYCTFFGVLLILFAFGCKQKKAINSTEIIFKPISMDSLFVVNNPTWEFFSTRAEVNVSGDAVNQSVGANIKMKKDEFVWLSASMFGIEGGRVYMQKDSITIINRLNRSYSKIDWDKAGAYIGSNLNLQIAQNILLGNTLLENNGNFSFSTDTAFYHVESISDNQMYRFDADSVHARIENSFFRGEKSGKHLTLKYGKFKNIDGLLLPLLINMNAKDGDQKFVGKIEIQGWDSKEFNVNMKVPGSFKRVLK